MAPQPACENFVLGKFQALSGTKFKILLKMTTIKNEPFVCKLLQRNNQKLEKMAKIGVAGFLPCFMSTFSMDISSFVWPSINQTLSKQFHSKFLFYRRPGCTTDACAILSRPPADSPTLLRETHQNPKVSFANSDKCSLFNVLFDARSTVDALNPKRIPKWVHPELRFLHL